MKGRLAALLIVGLLLGALFPAGSASAAININLNNYFYAHVKKTTNNTTDRMSFENKSGSKTLWGDTGTGNARLINMKIICEGMQLTDSIDVVNYHNNSEGSTQVQTESSDFNRGRSISLDPYRAVILSLVVKGPPHEVLCRTETVLVDDDDAAENIVYKWTADTPTQYSGFGSTPSATPTPTAGPSSTPAPTPAPAGDWKHYYAPYKDQYRVDYTVPPLAGYYKLDFVGASGQSYSATYDSPPTGIHWLTCNGTYQMKFYYADGTLFKQYGPMTTSQIKNPTCNSYEEGNAGSNDLNAKKTDGADGGKVVSWDQIPAAAVYEVWKDGQKVGETSGSSMPVGADGSLSVIAKDSSGAVVGQADLPADPSSGGGESGSGGGSCNGCDWIKQALACPAWNDYMGAWKDMLQEVYQPPDWEEVAGVMRDTIVPAMGQELVDRSPEMAKIFADEFTSREKPVAPPAALPTPFRPELSPTMTDLPAEVPFDMEQGQPDFSPDFGGSSPFVLPDPADVQLTNDDAGYQYPAKIDNSAPVYQANPSAPEPDPGYKVSVPDGSPPDYTITNPAAGDDSDRYYTIKNGESETKIPVYKNRGGGSSPAPTYQGGGAYPIPDYRGE